VRNIIAIARREVQSLFASPLAYVLTSAFLLAVGYFFNIFVRYYSEATLRMAQQPGGLEQLDLHEMVLRPMVANMQFFMLVIIPLLTMRVIAEERRQQTAELLFTSPVTTLQVVVGKFAGTQVLVAVMVGLTLVFPLFLAAKTDIDWGPLLSGYLGVLLLGSSFIAVGVFFSALTEHQILAGVLSLLTLIALWVMGLAAQLFDPAWREVMEQATFARHFDDFHQGVIDTQHVVYYLSVTAFFLFLTHRWLDSERWR